MLKKSLLSAVTTCFIATAANAGEMQCLGKDMLACGLIISVVSISEGFGSIFGEGKTRRKHAKCVEQAKKANFSEIAAAEVCSLDSVLSTGVSATGAIVWTNFRLPNIVEFKRSRCEDNQRNFERDVNFGFVSQPYEVAKTLKLVEHYCDGDATTLAAYLLGVQNKYLSARKFSGTINDLQRKIHQLVVAELNRPDTLRATCETERNKPNSQLRKEDSAALYSKEQEVAQLISRSNFYACQSYSYQNSPRELFGVERCSDQEQFFAM